MEKVVPKTLKLNFLVGISTFEYNAFHNFCDPNIERIPENNYLNYNNIKKSNNAAIANRLLTLLF